MKFFGTLVAATALFACGTSAVPLGDLGGSGIYPRAPADYNINDVLKDWIRDAKTQSRLGEIESEVRDAFSIPHTIREDNSVYKGRELADLVLPKTATKRGMVIKLKCENAYGQKGVKIKAPVHADIAKQRAVKPEFNDYTFVALAMAYTTEADRSLRKIGMKPVPGADADVVGLNKMRIYREDYKLKSLIDEIEDSDEAMYNFFLSKSRPGSPSGTPPSSSTPAPGKTAPGKTAPK